MLLSYPSDIVADFATNYTFSPSAPVTGCNDGSEIGIWDTMLAGTLVNSLQTANVFPGTTDEYWTGTNPHGTLGADTCEAWTVWETGTGIVGRASNTNELWLDRRVVACTSPEFYVCLCIK